MLKLFRNIVAVCAAVAAYSLMPGLARADGSWTGQWESDFGELRLVARAGVVVGDYASRGMIVAIPVEVGGCGQIGLRGLFTNGDRVGYLDFVRTTDDRYQGRWAFRDGSGAGNWTGRQIGVVPPRLQTFGRTVDMGVRINDPGLPSWILGRNETNFGPVSLVGDLRVAVGNYGNHGVVAGLWDGSRLRGFFTNGDRAGRFSWQPSTSAKSWTGSWNWADGTGGGSWSGRASQETDGNGLSFLTAPHPAAPDHGYAESIPELARCFGSHSNTGSVTKRALLAEYHTTRFSPLALTAPDQLSNLTLQNYSQQCAQAIGSSLPAFDCVVDGDEIPIYNGQPAGPRPNRCDNPALLGGPTDACAIGSRLGRMNSASHPTLIGDPNVEIAFICRKYEHRPGQDLYDDIAVIHHNTANGATCWYQSEFGTGLDPWRSAVPAPSQTGMPAPSSGGGNTVQWMTPSRTMGVRCGGCHGADPFIRTPYVDAVSESAVSGLPRHPMGPYWNYAFHEWDQKNEWHTLIGASGPLAGCGSCHRLTAKGGAGSTDLRGASREEILQAAMGAPDTNDNQTLFSTRARQAWMHAAGTSTPYTLAAPGPETAAALRDYIAQTATLPTRAVSPLLAGTFSARITTTGTTDVFTACARFSDEVNADKASAVLTFDDGRTGSLTGTYTDTSHLSYNYQHSTDSGEGELIVRFGRNGADGDWRSTVNGKSGGWVLTRVDRCP